MNAEIEDAFAALSVRAKIAVLARAIHMETIHNRDQPESAERLYRSSEFIHRLVGFIMSLAYRPEDFQRDATWASKTLVEGVEVHGQPYLAKLHDWIVEVRTVS
ncbi:hypothetical protein [Novosphingobium sp. ES2-1]|jgi:hypothetical protein|uniref:hypothetical protein n=1 Tax=Novosphingobium sp. ES2-1 TaxID=2780074 RepID=UPI00187F1EC0|nr:hypothetical protein [Novosphingobium sp. ES2-1]QOV96350.1 hypothetical protein IM701_18870 [Novosphingobium sp. ES2-1]